MATIQVLGTDKTIRINNYNVLGLVQNFNWAPNFNAQDINELGRTTRLDTLMELETSGSFEVIGTGNLAGILARMKVKTNSGTGAFEGYDYAPTPSGTKINDYLYTQDDLTALKFDIVQHERTNQTQFDRSTYLACCYPTTLNGRVDANGFASDTINFAGLYAVGFPSPYHDIRAVPCARASSTTITTPTGYTSTDWEVAYVTVDSRPVRKVVTDPANIVSFTGNTITLSGVAVANGVVVMAALFKKTPETDWDNVHTPDVIGSEVNGSQVFGIRGFQANIYIAPANAAAPDGTEQWLRVQSMDYTIDLRVEALRQVAFNQQGTTIYHRAATTPLQMTVNATVIESDWADWKAVLRNKSFNNSGLAADVYDNTYDFAPDNLKKEFAVVVEYFTKNGTKIQTLTFGDLRVDGMGNRVAIGGRGEVTWTFRGSSMTVQGYDIA